MLHDLTLLIGSSVSATDGEIGAIQNFLFDDRTWRIRYLVVGLHNWLQPRAVVLAIEAVEQPDWAKRSFRAKLTKEQVRNSPGLDEKRPVARQQQIAMRDYFGRFAYWLDKEWGGRSVTTGVNFPLPQKEDHHLRSAWDLTGWDVWARHGKMGMLKGFIVDEASRHIDSLIVKCGDWLQSRTALVPSCQVKSISWPNRRVDLEHDGRGTVPIVW